jgi:phosphate transport system permease protein
MSRSSARVRHARAVEAAMKVVTGGAAAGVVLTAIGLLAYLLWRGLPGISWHFLSGMPLQDPPGIWPAIVGTFWLTVGTATFALPVGVAAGIYLAEYAKRGRRTRLIRLSIANMAGVPSVVYGLFGAALFVMMLKVCRCCPAR